MKISIPYHIAVPSSNRLKQFQTRAPIRVEDVTRWTSSICAPTEARRFVVDKRRAELHLPLRHIGSRHAYSSHGYAVRKHALSFSLAARDWHRAHRIALQGNIGDDVYAHAGAGYCHGLPPCHMVTRVLPWDYTRHTSRPYLRAYQPGYQHVQPLSFEKFRRVVCLVRGSRCLQVYNLVYAHPKITDENAVVGFFILKG